MSNELQRKIAFSKIKGFHLDQASEMLERFGSVDAFFTLPTKELWNKLGAQPSFCSDVSRDALLELGRRESEFVQSNHVDCLFMNDSDFPTRLLECSDAPIVIYRLGHCNLNAAHVVSIVGTRRATAYGQKFVSDLVSGLADRLDDLLVVSGLAYGIDVAAHKAAMQAGIPTVGVVAHGLTTIYPADHRDIAARMVKGGGAIVTEYTSDSPVHRGNFLARNRIVAGMSDVTVVVESDEKGGAMVTASIALSYNRDVCAAPGRSTDRYSTGPLKLISTNRAALIRNADDLIELMNWDAKPLKKDIDLIGQKKSAVECDPEKKQIVNFLRINPKATVNDIAASLEIPYATLSARLMELEMDDIIVALPGSSFSINE